MDKHVFSVKEINQVLKEAIENSNYFKNIYVRGEVSNLTFNKSGHVYFSLKDEISTINAMIWKSNSHKLANLNLKEGTELICYGRLTYYVPNGRISFEVVDVSVEGVGDLQLLFEERFKEIQRLGWTDQSVKKPIPSFPKNIGIITADTGAAIKDLITTINRRMPSINIFLFPSMVQGEFAKIDIAKKIKQANQFQTKLDLLIVGRGGGSYEDLWSFNEMEVLKAIVDSNIPIISAVGHEPDITLSDYVADLRAATPTAAGELASPNISELYKELEYNYNNQKNLIIKHYENQDIKIEQLLKDNVLTIKNKLNTINNELFYLENNIKNNISNQLIKQEILLEGIESKNILLNPKKPLEKGYGLLINDNNKVINSIDLIDVSQDIKIILKDGEIITTVKGKQKHGK